jgi:non-ribosomal peptide synthetase component F/acyl carrier protein
MYKTGDLGRYHIDGNIECLGRNDNQVKLRGFRIELGEIENALVTHSDVVGAAVIVREDRPGDRRLCAYYVASAEIAESKLRAHLKSTLPDYMVPQHFVPLDKMPLTPSGKIDRKALPAPSGDSRGTDDFVEPNTPSERLVAELWKQALVVARVSATDDFFALGGHSLLASQILARLRVEHGIVIPFRKMFEAPTIAAFAKLVEACDKDGTPNPSPSIPRISDRGSAPLSLNQERIWILEEMDPQKWSPHLLPAAWRLKGALDVGYLKAAMQLLVERHELLRTSFHLVDGKPSQRVTDSLVFDLVERDLSKLSAAERDRELEMLFDADAEIPYDLSRAPLMRSILIKMAEEDYVLYSSRHNIIWDGWSFDLYLRDLSTAYAAIRTGSKPDLPALQISYADFAAWHREWLRGPEQAKQFVYWQKQLDGEFAPLALPTDRTRPAVRNHAGANAWVHVSTADAERLTAIGHDKGATLYTVLLSAFATLLYRYTGQRHLLIGTPVRARTRPETEDVVGPFVNTLALRFQVDPNLSFLELLAQARDTTLDAFSNQESPLEALGAKAPAVRVSFSLQDARTRPPDFGDLKIAQQHIMHRSSVNDLTLWTMYSAKDLLTVLNYSTELFNGSTIERFLDAYQSLLASILQNPMEKLDNLNVISKETRQFAEQAGRGNSRQTLPETIGQSLSIHAKADESRIAIKYGQQTLTYGEFRHELGATVSMLQSNGVGSSSCIALLGARSIAGCVAVVAAMELGAKCVAIDGDNPPSVVQELLRRETVDTVLTDTQFRERHAKALASIDSARIFAIESSKGAGGDRADLPAYRSLDQLESAKILCGAGGHNDNLFLGSTYAEILAAVAELNTTLKSSSADTVLSLDKFGTVSWVLEASFTLSAGATLIMPAVPETGTRVTDVAWVEANRPTVVFGPSELLYTLCEDSKWQAPVARIVCVGLPARGKILEIMLKRSSEVWNVFSFMEGAVWNTVQQFSESTDRFQIGRALGNSQIEVIDDKGRMCPPGVPGRVRITRGNGDSVITTERARLLGNGSFEYNGPGRDIAWILGQRVNLRAIEEALSSHPSMRESAVTALERAPGEPALVAYFVPQADSAFTETELRKYLRQNLPEFMVPQEFMELSSMPRNAEGVVALTKLPSPFASNDRILLPPRTEAELLVAEIWQRALELERVSLDDNFFNIGGHSLLCFQVIDDIQRRTGIRLSPRTMLLDTLEQVAAGLGAPKPQAAAPIPGPATPDTSFGSKLLGKLRKLSGN